MDKKLIAKLFSGLIIIAYGSMLLLQSIFNFGAVQLIDIWHYILLIVLGLILLARSASHEVDSSLWLGVVFTIYGALGCVTKYTDFSYAVLWPTFIGAFAIASLSVFLFFKKTNHLKVFVFFGGISLALFFQSFGIITVSMLIPALVILIGVMILLNSVLPHRSIY